MPPRPLPPSRPARWLVLLLPLALVGCAQTTSPPPPVNPSPTFAPPDHVTPPRFDAPVASGTDAAHARAREETLGRRRDILDAAWTLVRDKHYDKTLGGLDWTAVRARYEPRALASLGQSHMMVVGPGSEDEIPEAPPTPGAKGERASPDAAPAPATEGIGDPGLTVRAIEGQAVITSVRAGSSAARAGLAPGFVVTAIGGHALTDAAKSRRPLRPSEERFAVRRTAAHRLQGEVGSKVTVRYLDAADRPGEVVLERERLAGTPVQIGNLPPLYPETKARLMGEVGVIRFNFFLLQPVLADVKSAIARFRGAGAKAIVLDVRGNPGGQGAMSIPVAAAFVKEPLTLGTLQFRDFSQTLTARPSLDVTPYLGPLVILTDEGSASTSEMLAAGLQEARRAVVVGQPTLGAVLPSLLDSLPHQAIMQYVVADFRTPKGVLLENRGVQPDRMVVETRAAFRDGRDPILEAGLDEARLLIRKKQVKP